uniref:Transposase (Putative), gypsy type n=1 Tax=Tanacetum cinerariifolium TaxID=118510 RepID=A0A699GSV3_TANCI|nr:hypothetical protein [Tanacetum cinerariifolium]
MSTITDIKCVLSRKAFSAFCEKFHILEEVHLVLPNRDNTIHERPVGKIRLYTRFFDFANFRLPLSTFLVDILRYFRINISQLFVIGAAKKFPEEFLCLVGHSRHYTLDEDIYPLFVDKNGEVAPDRGERELEASVDKLFDEGGSGTQAEQRDSAGGEGGLGINILPVAETMDTAAEDVVPLQPRRQKKENRCCCCCCCCCCWCWEGCALIDVAGHNPSAEADYVSALQQLQSVNFPLLAELMVPIHHSPSKTVVGASALSLALDIFYARVQRIRENIISHGSLFQDVFIPLAEPLTAAAVIGMKDDYGVMGMDDQSTVTYFWSF